VESAGGVIDETGAAVSGTRVEFCDTADAIVQPRQLAI